MPRKSRRKSRRRSRRRRGGVVDCTDVANDFHPDCRDEGDGWGAMPPPPTYPANAGEDCKQKYFEACEKFGGGMMGGVCYPADDYGGADEEQMPIDVVAEAEGMEVQKQQKLKGCMALAKVATGGRRRRKSRKSRKKRRKSRKKRRRSRRRRRR